ncbi:MAG: ATP-binding protein [Candidatus Aureabacteria bacterium]|jgi:predicted ATPase|nr:ATP-binding protein [Candidatus Auribacterota bacterium]NLW94134.1 ATP-binding protein [Chlamydiota bacterium]
MITLVEALNYRCLKYIRHSLTPFQVLVGPNATGKTTFLDVIAFLGDLVSHGLEAAVSQRVNNPVDLTWWRKEDSFELAIEALIPEKIRKVLENPAFDRIRYEVAVGMDVDGQGIGIMKERVLLKIKGNRIEPQRELFPHLQNVPASILSRKGLSRKQQSVVVSKEQGGNENFYPETPKGYKPSYPSKPRRVAFANLPPDEKEYPVSLWFKDYLASGIQQFILNSLEIRKASPPKQIPGFKPDGSNIPWVIERLKENDPERFTEWVEHLQTALPDLVGIRTIERKDDKHRYMMLQYRGGLEVPSWLASDGTLRLLALTLPAYLREFRGCYIVEEPENGIHPRAVETVVQSLSSVYEAQVLMATHSPVVLSDVDVSQVLCLAKTEDGATDIVRGDRHPKLKDWKGAPNLSVLFAGGVLG